MGHNQWSYVDWNNVPWETLGPAKRRQRLMSEANFACTVCGFNSLRPDGFSILQVDHIDGDRKNNTRENLRVVCPNCHALTSEKHMHFGQHHSDDVKHKMSVSQRARYVQPSSEGCSSI